MSYEILDTVNSPEDIKALDGKKIEPLCAEIREFLVEKVSVSGGHLASNLGVVELSVALHRVFDTPTDHIIFDVGHQAYVHKLLTGRRDMFDVLRKPGGLSGFTVMRESEHDAFGAGHSSTSISAALGYAEADRLAGKDNYTVAVIGDGAYTGGMVHEAINNCHPDLPLIIVINENGMSISTNKGAFASYLSRVRISKGYIRAKKRTGSFLEKIPLLGKPVKSLLTACKNLAVKLLFRPNYFEELGFYYIGPIDGNDYEKVELALKQAKELKKCVFVHIKTKKGKGCTVAEQSPEVYHSVANAKVDKPTYHEVFAEKLVSLAAEDKSVVAITPAMGIGTGLDKFEESYPDRYFDVGIAEEHALTFSAGLCAGGLKPYAAIYSTFLQRGYDNIIHDIALQSLPVRFIIDRAGLAPSDGATHHGIFDVAFLSHTPGVEIISPVSYCSLDRFLELSVDTDHPTAIRYPNTYEDDAVREQFFSDEAQDLSRSCKVDFDIENPPAYIFVTYGSIVSRVLAAKRMLEEKGVSVGIVLVERIKPFDDTLDLIKTIVGQDTQIVYVEEGIKNGGAGMITRSRLYEMGVAPHSFKVVAIDDNFVIPDTLTDIYDYAGLSPEKLINHFEL